MSPHSFSESKANAVITLRGEGKSFSVIAKETGIPKSTSQCIWEKLKNSGTTDDLRINSGRESLLTPNLARKLKNAIKATPDATAVELRRRIKDPVSPRSLRRFRRTLGFKPVKGKPKTPLSEKQLATRRDWCRKYLNDELEDVVWTDEKPFVLGRRRRSFWQGPGDALPEYIKYKTPVKVMIWGGISRRGKTTLHFVQGTINAKKYVDILAHHLVGPATRMYPEGFVLQQDRATPHTAKFTSNWLDEKGIQHFLTPPNSPELNPIELVWNIMESRVSAKNPTTKLALVRAIKKEWENISQEEIDKCILHSEKLKIARPHCQR
jgi:transposase